MSSKIFLPDQGLLPLTSDFIFKTLLTRYPECLSYVLATVLGSKEKITGFQILPTQTTRTHEQEKYCVFDVRVKDALHQIYNLEMQVYRDPAYFKRLHYYWAQAYQEQLSQSEDFQSLQTTYGIHFISGFNLLPAFHSLCLPLTLRNEDQPQIPFSSPLKIYIIKLELLSKKTIQELSTPLEVLVDLLKYSNQLTEKLMDTLLKRFPETHSTLNALSELSRDKRFLAEQERMSIERNSLWNLAQREGIEEGKAEGIQEGIEKGVEKGRAEQQKAFARDALRKKLPLETISDLTKLSIPEIQALGKPEE